MYAPRIFCRLERLLAVGHSWGITWSRTPDDMMSDLDRGLTLNGSKLSLRVYLARAQVQ
jgi:hypothetical protein